ncbi:DUF1624 domain-containing protein [Rhizobium sp. TRM96647]|uniref:heparan-alpha-glucosaminide N-acetyltransferase n=1 Tax=unclassified Rhizobium TaxID=2613769 RepID=UPI0021E93353|nr:MULTISPECIES: DUF1624 domain-containing protein [unclassified Rhizobium]MCV3737494.1 DUF1624 domain-containing protein [Rhizobium sp. TRM96647]MCV3756416.1 DUF1624 domain-containing protein [Rhizobium sp. TRM96650]
MTDRQTPTTTEQTQDSATARVGGKVPARRLAWLDAARGIALVAMAIYHFSWDLDYFGYIAPGTAATGGFRIFARLIAGSFIFLAGFGLVLGHRPAIRWRPFWIRMAKIVLAALAITVATYFIFPSSFIFFGILHLIAAASLLGLPFLRLPVAIVLLCSAAAFAAPHLLRSPVFDHPMLWWIGLSLTPPRSNDYVPLLPWFGAFLLGMAAAQLYGKWSKPLPATSDRRAENRAVSLLGTAGRHSLPIYLIHQPVLIALVYLFSLVVPPPAAEPVESYRNSCVAACSRDTDAGFCRTFCDCTLDRLVQGNLLDALNRGTVNMADARIAEISQQCTVEAYSTTTPPEE